MVLNKRFIFICFSFQGVVRYRDELRGCVPVAGSRSGGATLLGWLPGRTPVPIRLRRETGNTNLVWFRRYFNDIRKNEDNPVLVLVVSFSYPYPTK
jgi:hypothetical protein